MILGSYLQAQTLNESSYSERYTKQVGFNFTDFALRFLSFNEATGSTPSILVLYKKGNNGKKWRYGIGGSINWGKNPANSQTSQSVSFNFLFGREYYRNISQRWTAYYGWEVLPRVSFSKSESISFGSQEPQVNSLLTLRLGGQALVGIQYNFNERLSLLTESSYLIQFAYRKDEDSREDYSLRSFYISPISLILNYHF